MANETKIVITAATAQAEAALGKLGNSVGDISRKMFDLSGVVGTLGGALTVTAFAGIIKSSIDAADRLNDLAQKTGTSVEALAGLKFAADQNGTSLEAVANASKKLSTVMAESPDVLKKFGITAKDSTGALVQLADIFAAMPDGVDKTALAVKLLGKSGEEMIPFLNQGSEALRSMVEEGKRLNPITAEMAAQADQFNDDLAKLSAQFSGLGIAIAKDALKPMTQIAAAMAEAARDGGLLNAAMVGLASTWNALFTDDMLTRQQKIVKELEKLRAAMDAPNVSAYGKDAISKRMVTLQQELEGMQPKVATPVPDNAKNDKRGKSLYDSLGGDGKKKKQQPFDPEGDFWDQVDAARSKNQSKANDQAMRDYARSVEEANKIIYDIDPIAKASAEWEKLISLKEQGLLTDEQVGKAYQKTFTDISKSGDESFKSLEAAVRGWGSTFTKSFATALRTGRGDFSSFKDGIIQDLLEIQVQKRITDPMVKAGTKILDGVFGGGWGGGGYSSVADGALSFAGGGYTGSGSRSGGIDGMGGFPAILHPNETVIDHTLGQGVAAPNVVVNVVNQSGQNVNARQQGGAQFDGRNWVLGIVLDAADSDPNFRNALGVGRG